jgi:hypothetical protein
MAAGESSALCTIPISAHFGTGKISSLPMPSSLAAPFPVLRRIDVIGDFPCFRGKKVHKRGRLRHLVFFTSAFCLLYWFKRPLGPIFRLYIFLDQERHKQVAQILAKQGHKWTLAPVRQFSGAFAQAGSVQALAPSRIFHFCLLPPVLVQASAWTYLSLVYFFRSRKAQTGCTNFGQTGAQVDTCASPGG